MFIFIKEGNNLGFSEIAKLKTTLDKNVREKIGKSIKRRNEPNNNGKLLKILEENDVRMYKKFDETDESRTVFGVLLYEVFNGNVIVEKLLDKMVRKGFTKNVFSTVKL